jgi:hypothetical protein
MLQIASYCDNKERNKAKCPLHPKPKLLCTIKN